jgi:RNA polymerase sigma-70 factor (ECF subfamily)
MSPAHGGSGQAVPFRLRMTEATERDACDPERLAELVRRGDVEAFDRMTRCYGDRLLRAGRRHCRTCAEAEDAVQDALLIAAESLHQFRGEGSVEGWLVRIVASACRRIGRGRKNDAALHDADTEPEDGTASPEVAVARRELGELLNRALLDLSPEDRLIVIFAELEGSSHEEIARKMGLGHGAVRTRLSRLRARLRGALAPVLEDSAPGR